MRSFKSFQIVGIMLGVLNSGILMSAEHELQPISPVESEQLLQKKSAIILDVREDSEWNEQHIPGAIHIPLAQLPGRLAELKSYQDSQIIAQCRSGRRSAQASDVLKSAGFSKVYNMEGGIIAWEKAGLKTE